MRQNSIVQSFIKIELADDEIRADLIKLISDYPNLVSFEYECNEYNVLLNGSTQTITLRNAVHEEHSIPKYYKRVYMAVDDFLKILSQL